MYKIIVVYIGLCFATGAMQSAAEGKMGSTVKIYWKRQLQHDVDKYIVIKDYGVYADIVAAAKNVLEIPEEVLLVLKDSQHDVIDLKNPYYIPKGFLENSPIFFLEDKHN
jgi:hypothetical protein